MSDDKAAKPPLTAYFSLRRRRQKFVDAYVECGIGAQAMRDIGFKGRRPELAASKLMQIPEIRAAVAERTQEAIAAAGVTHLRTMRELAHVAFFDHRKLLDVAGNVLPVHQWPSDVAAAIAGMDVEELFEGRGEERVHVGRLKKYRAWPKTEALKLLMQYQKLLVESHEHTGKDGAPLAPPMINIGFANGGPGDSSPSAKGS